MSRICPSERVFILPQVISSKQQDILASTSSLVNWLVISAKASEWIDTIKHTQTEKLQSFMALCFFLSQSLYQIMIILGLFTSLLLTFSACSVNPITQHFRFSTSYSKYIFQSIHPETKQNQIDKKYEFTIQNTVIL